MFWIFCITDSLISIVLTDCMFILSGLGFSPLVIPNRISWNQTNMLCSLLVVNADHIWPTGTKLALSYIRRSTDIIQNSWYDPAKYHGGKRVSCNAVFLMEDNDPFIPQLFSRYHDCEWTSDTRSQCINSHDVDLVLPWEVWPEGHATSDFNQPHRVKSLTTIWPSRF